MKRCQLLEKCKSKVQWGTTSHQSEWPSLESLQITNAGEDMEKRETSYTTGRNVRWGSHFGKQYGGSSGEGNGTPLHQALAWKIPWTEEPGRPQSMGLLRVRHNWATSLSLFTFMHWRRKWQPTPVFLPGESQGWGSLVGCRLWGHTESGTTEVT